jgi:hypothetical protein
MLKLVTIRRDGSLEVLGHNLAVKVLIEKSARVELGFGQRTGEDVDRADLGIAHQQAQSLSGRSFLKEKRACD